MNIPVKPSDVTFTDDQWRAIWATGQDILVSAAAGSGKTKVLITRMIEKVLDKDNPIDVDQLLVVTFTNASAAEMRHRMAVALEEAIHQFPDAVHLRRQLNLLNKAHISTLHSFCQHVVRQYAYLLDIDPGFRIADSTEAAILRDDTIGEILEEAYSADNPEMVYRLADSFTSDRNDQMIETLISKLYDYSRVHSSPEKWLRAIPEEYEIADIQSVDELSFIEPLKNAILYSLEEAVALTREMRRIALLPDGPEPLVATADADLFWINEAVHRILNGTWEETFEHFGLLTWVRAGSIKKDSCDEMLADRAKAIRDDVKKIVNDVKIAYFTRRPSRLLEEIRLMAQPMHTLIDLVLQFSKRYEAVKIDRGIVDFSDLEHYALRILSEEQDGKLVPSDIALDYQKRFAEVLVDEYQDTNLLQETILQLVKSGGEADGNLFMVGDVKQSIYRFRLAEPKLFLGKYLRFLSEFGEAGLKIDLNANFRSRKEVLDATNYIFSQVMNERVGEIEYDEAAALKYGAQYSEKEVPTKLTLLYKEEEDPDEEVDEETESLKNAQVEARYMIQRIRELMESGAEVTDAFSDEKRPLAYKDIVILMRSMTWSGQIVDEFKLAGIPIDANLSKGYFDAVEVMVMLNTLRVIDNPYQDIPLASVLRSPFVGLTENELAAIRLTAKNEPFYEALKLFISKGGAGVAASTQQKLQRLMMHFEDWRNLARRGSLSELIWQVYTDTYYYEMVGAMPNGKQRQANLRALHDRAIEYEKTSFRGLFRFLRFVDRMRKRGDDLGEAKSTNENDDVVRIMTIHSSKGLEFPYVFIAGTGRQFNKMDFNEAYLFDQHFGLAVKAVDADNRIMYTSLPFLAMKEKKELEMRAEEMRILYVAMTRAKESLDIVASISDIEKEVGKWQYAQLTDEAMLPAYTRSRAKGYIDWIGPAIARHPAFEKFGLISGGQWVKHSSNWDLQAIPFSAMAEMKQEDTVGNEIPQTASDDGVDEHLLEKVKQQFDEIYSFESAVHKRSKQSVSELKRIALLEQTESEFGGGESETKSSIAYLHDRPNFMQKRSISPAEIGTAMHTIMQHIDLNQHYTAGEVAELITTLQNRQLLSVDEAKSVRPSEVAAFFHSSISERLKNAEQIYRELPFTYALRDSEGDKQILQGIADCLFKENGRWVLLDYKTDRVTGRFDSDAAVEKEMQARYGIQLNLYKKAIEEIAQIEIEEMVIYLFDGERVLAIQGEEL